MKTLLTNLWLISTLGFSAGLMADEALKISADEAKLIIKNIVLELEETYIDPEKARSAADELSAKLRAGNFSSSSDFDWFKHVIRSTLVNRTQDSGFKFTRFDLSSSHDSNDQNHAGIKSEVLENNIGYLDISGNLDFPDSSNVIEQYFKSLSGVDAMIIDLRSADKGSIALTQKMLGFFIESDKAICIVKSSNRAETIRVVSTDGFERFKPDLPLYILNSAFVTGPWELFSYALQENNRSTIVGEVTMGVGTIEAIVKVNDDIFMEMTQAVIKGPDNLDAWDQQGIVPDHFAKQSEALTIAYNLALDQLIKK